jgi:hypothetical protein
MLKAHRFNVKRLFVTITNLSMKMAQDIFEQHKETYTSWIDGGEGMKRL